MSPSFYGRGNFGALDNDGGELVQYKVNITCIQQL